MGLLDHVKRIRDGSVLLKGGGTSTTQRNPQETKQAEQLNERLKQNFKID